MRKWGVISRPFAFVLRVVRDLGNFDQDLDLDQDPDHSAKFCDNAGKFAIGNCTSLRLRIRVYASQRA